METLFDYYQSQGKSLPSVQERQGIASSAGISGYTGTSQQNSQLLGYLKNQNATPSGVISGASLQNVPKTQLPTTPQPTQPTAVPSMTTTLLSEYDLNRKEQQAKEIQDTGIDQYLRDIVGLQGEAQTRSEELGKTDFTKNRSELLATENRFRQLEAEKAQDDTTLIANMRAEEVRDTLLPFAQMGQAKLAGDAAIIRALKTSEQNMLNARALSLQGNIDLARQTAEDAVNIKYAPYKERIKTYESVVKALEPYLTSAEKKQAQSQQIKANLAMKEIDKLSNFQDTALKNAISNNAPQSVISKILSANSIEGITSVGGNFITSASDKLDLALKRAQLNKISIENAQTKTGTGKPPTDTQITNAGYASRIAQSNKIIDSKLDALKNMNYLQFKLVESNSPLANRTLTPDQRQAAQAMRNFITAKLRKESGAAISPTEFDDARTTYFPALGDDEGTLANKKQLRDSVLNNLVQGSGSAYQSNPLDTYLDVVVSSTSPTGVNSTSYAQSIYQSIPNNKK